VHSNIIAENKENLGFSLIKRITEEKWQKALKEIENLNPKSRF
jgi:hypothetical protein